MFICGRTSVVTVIKLSIYYEPEKGQYSYHKKLKKSGKILEKKLKKSGKSQEFQL